MAQLSMPYRIALVALLMLSGVWFTVLRPGAVVERAASTTGEGVTSAVGAAKDAAAASDARTEVVDVGDPEAKATREAPSGKAAKAADAPAKDERPKPADAPSPSAPAAEAPQRPARASGDRSARLLTALDEGRAVVLLFTGGGADDREVRRAVQSIDRRGGEVLVRRAGITEVGRYQAITRGAPVFASPTVLVLGPGHDARAITGLTTRGEIEEAVREALDTTGDPPAAARNKRGFAVRSARQRCDGAKACVTHFTAANDACVTGIQQASAAAAAVSGQPSIAVHRALRGATAAAITAFAAVPAPAAQRAGHAKASAILRTQLRAYDRALRGTERGAVVSGRLSRDRVLAGTDAQLSGLGYLACA